MIGLDDDLIYTLGNGTMHIHIPGTISAMTGQRPSSGVSAADQSFATMEKRMFQIEDS